MRRQTINRRHFKQILMNIDKYSERLNILESHGFVQKKGCITNGKYAFLYHQIDTSEMTDEQFTEFIELLKSKQ